MLWDRMAKEDAWKDSVEECITWIELCHGFVTR